MQLWTALDEYVWNRPSPVYSWKVVSTAELDDVHVVVLNMTSQMFLSSSDVDRPLWYHFMVVAVPKRRPRVTDRAFMYIDGGANRPNRPPSPHDPNALAVQAARNVGCIAMQLYQIPNQPLLFYNDTVLPGKHRTEDALIAWTWDMFVRSGGKNPFILARMPMVKASILAMDTVEAYVRQHHGIDTISKWAVSGASKRGWTAWLVAATDHERVDTVVPIVIDIVDTEKVLLHIRASICGWPEAMQDYVVQGITDLIGSDKIRKLFDIIDPLVYNERFRHIEKYLINAGNDQFFWPDGSVFGYHKLEGPKSLRYVPNSGHSLSKSDAVPVLFSYLARQMHRRQPIPRYRFMHSFTDSGVHINAWLEPNDNGQFIQPEQVKLWTITNPKARDFRLEVVGRTWQSQHLSVTDMKWEVHVPNPPVGYTAAMMEFTYDEDPDNSLETAAPIKFTTSAYITPDRTPCHE